MNLAAAVLLAVVSLSVVPDGGRHNVAKDAKSKQQPANSSSVEKQPSPTPDQRQAPKNVQPRDEQYAVTVKEMPPKDTWDKVYVVLTGVLVGVGIMTFIAVLKQAVHTRRAADAARDSIRLQETALRQWVDLVNWKLDYIPSKTGQPAFLKITVDVVNPTSLPLTIHKGHIAFGGNTAAFLADEFVMTPRNPYTVDLGLFLSDKQEWDFLRTGLWFSVRGELPHVGTLRELQPQPICGHLTCVNGQPPMWHPEMPAETDGQDEAN